MWWNFWSKKTKEETKKVNLETVENDSGLYKFKLTSFGEATYVAKVLAKKGKVLIDLEGLEQKERRRILDFLSGTIFFQEGKAKKVRNNIYYFFLPDAKE